MRKIPVAFSHINFQRKIKKQDAWAKKTTNEEIISSDPLKIYTYRRLVMAIAQIGYYNRDLLMFFRGQHEEYYQSGSTTILPSIYRKDPGQKTLPLKDRFKGLNSKSEELLKILNSKSQKLSGTHLVNKFPEIRYSIIQHYEVFKTPLLDLTHSIHVASSFAFDNNKGETGIVYVFGMPTITESISYYINDELLNIRLLSISPPQAKRPFFQEGYLAGPFPLYKLDDSRRVIRYDFARRLIAKFEIPITEEFWGEGFTQIPHNMLYQPNDIVKRVCMQI